MHRLWVVVSVALAIGASRCAGAGKNPSGQKTQDQVLELLAASGKAVAAAKSYESTWLITSSMGSMGAMKTKMEMKMLPRRHKAFMRVLPDKGSTGMMAMGAAMSQSVMVMDGNTMYMYLPMLHGYYKQTLSPEAVKSMMGGPVNLSNLQHAMFKYLGTTKFDGKACDAIQVTPPEMPQTKQMGMTMKMVLYFDKATHRMRGMRQVMTIKGTPAPPGAPPSAAGHAPMVITTVGRVVSEKFNVPIPESVFKFTPPPGTKELPMPAMPGKGMGPGMGMPGMGLGGAAPH
ncbi:MAG: LolA family protein [Chthonomonadales bacterium]